MNSDLPLRLTALRRSLEIDGPALEHSILDEAQFTNEDVLRVTGLSPSQLHNWVSRGWLALSGVHNPGKGRRRLFCGSDVIAIELAQTLAPFSMIPVAKQLLERTGWLTVRPATLLDDAAERIGLTMHIYMIGDDWLFVSDTAPADHHPTDVYAGVQLAIDQLIIRTLERLNSILNGEDLPPKDIPVPPTAEQNAAAADEYYGVNDFDSEGAPILSGLTVEETVEYRRLDAAHIAERLHDYDTGPFTCALTVEEEERYDELSEKHHLGRMNKIARSIQERQK